MSGRSPPHGEQPDKGKGKDTDHDVNTPSHHDAPASPSASGGSVFSRITQSAAGLGRDLVNTRPGGGELAALSSSAAGGKGAASSSSRGGASSGSAAAQELAPGPGNRNMPAASSPSLSGGFRSHAQQHAAAQEQAFSQFLDGTSIDMSMPEQPIIGADMSVVEDAWARAQPAQPAQSTQPRPPALSDVALQESRDGFEVVDLLSADGPPEEEPNYGDIELAEDEATALKHALFGSSSSSSSSAQPLPAAREWDNVLNFIPDFVRPHTTGGYDHDGSAASASMPVLMPVPSVKTHETQAALGMPHSSESTRIWLDQWHAVLTRYDDEVWGGLSPLVVQAREEVDQLKEAEAVPSPPASTKALDRLRQILGHLRVDG